MDDMSIEEKILNIRKDIIKAGFHCGTSAHFGGGLSIVELLAVLYEDYLRYSPGNPYDPNRDIFILSKGHGVLGYFATLKNYGFMSAECFSTFQQNGSKLIAHPVLNIDIGIESSNGSLGQGLSFASGIALASCKKKDDRRIFVLLGDGECNEGSVWEAAMFCAQQQLHNLIAIIDNNGFQNDGPVEDIISQQKLAEKWAAFDWHTQTINGNSVQEIREAYDKAIDVKNMPSVIVAKTIKGFGISLMQDDNDWHHNRLTQKNYEIAMQELELANV